MRCSTARRRVIAFEVRIPASASAGKAEDHFRSVSSGGRRHEPALRRHGSGLGDQPRTGDVAGRRNPPQQRARSRQHVYFLLAGNLYRFAISAAATDARAPTAAGAADRSSSSPSRKRSPMIANRSLPGDPVVLIVEDDPHFAQVLLDLVREQGLKGVVTDSGRARPRPRPPIQPAGDHARYFLAGHARMDGFEPSETGSRHPPHPGADHQRRGRAPARTWDTARSLI